MRITSFEDAVNAEKNPYSNSGFFFDKDTNIYVLDDLSEDNEWYEDINLRYAIHWEGEVMFSETGVEIEPAYEG